MRKKLTAVLLAATMLLTSGVTVFADRVDAVIDKPYLALGADLTPQEQMKVLSLLGLSDINVDDYDIISITNADEHEYLDKYLDASIIGTRALSSVLVVGKEAGNGIHVTTKNISYCTEGMYRNALLTAGIEDADITVAGPFSISGTAALVGAIKAYETMTGEEIDDENLDAVIPCLLHTHLQKCLINLLMTVSCHHPHTDFGIAVDKAFSKSVAVKIMYCHDISVLKASEDTCDLIVKDPQSS